MQKGTGKLRRVFGLTEEKIKEDGKDQRKRRRRKK